MHWNLVNDQEFGSLKFLKLKYTKGDLIIQLFCRIGSPQEIRSPVFNLRKFQKPEKSTTEWCRMHWNLMNNKEFGSFKLLKLKYRRGKEIIQPFWRIASPKEIRSSVLNLRKFQNLHKELVNHVECTEIQWMTKNLAPSNFQIWNKVEGTKEFSHSAELVPPKKLRPPSLIWWILEKMRKYLLNHMECIEI